MTDPQTLDLGTETVSPEDLEAWVRIAEFIRTEPAFLSYLAAEKEDLYDIVSAGLRLFAINARSEEWRDDAGLGGRPEQLIPGTAGSFSPRADWAVWLLMGGRGCVATGTMLDTPTGQVPVEDWSGGELISLYDDGIFRPTWAEPSVLVGEAEMFRLVTDRGDEIVTTAQHRFLTPLGWCRLKDIDVGAYVASRQDPSDQSGCREDDRRWLDTEPGSQFGCRQHNHSDDPRLRWGPEAARDELPSPSGAHGRSPQMSRSGGHQTSPTSSRPYPESDHHPKNSSYADELWLPNDRRLDGSSSVSPTHHHARNGTLSQRPSYLDPSSFGRLQRSALSGRVISRLRELVRQYASSTWRQSALKNRSDGQFRASTSRSGTSLLLSDSSRGIPSLEVNRWARVVSIQPVGNGRFWDLTVPGAENYLANGMVSHNSGKSRTGAEATREFILGRKWQEPPRWALVGQTLESVRIDMVENTLLPILPPGSVAQWNRGPCELWLTNGAFLKGYSSEAPRKLRGPNFNGAWADELATFKDAHLSPQAVDTTWSNMMMAMRAHDHHTWQPRVVATTTPKAKAILRNPDPGNPDSLGPGLVDSDYTIVSNMSTLANQHHLSQHYIDTVVKPLLGTRLYDQEVLGKLVDEDLNAQWTSELIDKMRRPESWPAAQGGGLKRVVIGVDPSVGAGRGDECGIVVSGLAADGRAYILEDCSLKAAAPRWVQVIRRAYEKWHGDCIIAEKNMGGELVRETIGRYAPNLPVVDVVAIKGKVLRAEPVALLSDQDRLRIAGTFPRLETQMKTYDGEGSSPDRLDAMVFSILHLLPPRTGLSDIVRIGRGIERG